MKLGGILSAFFGLTCVGVLARTGNESAPNPEPSPSASEAAANDVGKRGILQDAMLWESGLDLRPAAEPKLDKRSVQKCAGPARTTQYCKGHGNARVCKTEMPATWKVVKCYTSNSVRTCLCTAKSPAPRHCPLPPLRTRYCKGHGNARICRPDLPARWKIIKCYNSHRIRTCLCTVNAPKVRYCRRMDGGLVLPVFGSEGLERAVLRYDGECQDLHDHQAPVVLSQDWHQLARMLQQVAAQVEDSEMLDSG